MFVCPSLCLLVCLFVRVFLCHIETDWDTLWHKEQLFKYLRKPFLDSHMRNVVPKFRSCRLNGVATIAITYIHTYLDTNILLNLGNT